MNKRLEIMIFFFICSFCSLLFAIDKYSKLQTGLKVNNVNINQYKLLLIIPENSCQGCLRILLNNLEGLTQNKDLKLIYLSINRKIYSDSTITVLDYYKNYEYFNELLGITIYIINNGNINQDIEIIPQNINEIINIISKKNIKYNDLEKLKKLNNDNY